MFTFVNFLDIHAQGVRHICPFGGAVRGADLHPKYCQFREPYPRANATAFIYSLIGRIVAKFGKFGAQFIGTLPLVPFGNLHNLFSLRYLCQCWLLVVFERLLAG